MSNALRKIRKNAEEFTLKDFYNKMTPEQYQKGIQTAIERTKKELTAEFEKKYKKLVDEFNYNLQDGMKVAINTISVELIYELAVQMNAFEEEDEEIRKQIIDKVQEIYEHTMDAIKNYSKYKNERQVERELKKRKNKIEKYFNLKF